VVAVAVVEAASAVALVAVAPAAYRACRECWAVTDTVVTAAAALAPGTGCHRRHQYY